MTATLPAGQPGRAATGVRRRHLAYVLKRYPRISETFVAAELLELQRQREQVTVFAISKPDEPFTHAFLDDIRFDVVYLPHRPLRSPGRVLRSLWRVLRSTPAGWLRAAGYACRAPRPLSFRRLAQATVLRAEMAERGIDHAHAHFATAAARLASLAERMGGPTYSVTTHAKDIYHRDVNPRHLRERLARASFVATVSEFNARHLAGVLGAAAPPLAVVPNAVDLRRMSAVEARNPTPGRILVVARLVEKKGLPDVLDAAAVLASRGVGAHVEVVGAGPLLARLQEQAEATAAPVTFLGPLPHEQVLERMRAAWLFCLPCVVAADGDRDGLPTSVLEAMALGVPVVATAMNGLGEVVLDGRTGLVVPERDPAALADVLHRLLTDAALADRLGRTARDHVAEHFSLSRSVAQLRAMFPGAEGVARCG